MSPLAVLHVSQPTVAGVAHLVRSLVEDQSRRGMDVSVACPPTGELWGDARAAGVTTLAWPATRSPGPSVLSETRRLARIVRVADPDIVHLHSSKAGLAGRLAVRGRVPTVFQPSAWSFLATREPTTRLAIAWERAAVRWTHALAVVSEGEREAGLRAGIHGPWKILPNATDVEKRRPASDADRTAARRFLGFAEGPLVVCLGRLAKQKGQHVLLDAWPAVKAALPDARLALVGDGPDLAALAARAGEDVTFAGDQRDVDPWLTAADIVALPSRFEAGLSLAAMEAMALGRCVVASDVAGVREGLAGGAGGIVPIDDSAALGAAIIARLSDPALAAREAALARARVVEHYDLKVACERTVSLYQRLLEDS